MRYLTLLIFLSIGLLAGTAVGQTPRLKIFIAPSDPVVSPVSGKITAVAIDPRDPVTVYRITEGDYKLASPYPATEPVAILAGKTVRLRIAAANNRSQFLLKSSVPISYAEPCEGPPKPSPSGAEITDLITTGVVTDTSFDWKTEEAWRGTCRVMVFELVDRWEYAIKVRFN